MVTYAKLPDAQAAMKSQKPILDNRFIQVAWHKPPPPKPEPTAETKIDQVCFKRFIQLLTIVLGFFIGKCQASYSSYD